MTPEELDRVLAEELPTGLFGNAPAAAPRKKQAARKPPAPDPRAADHQAQLLAALAGTSDHRVERRRHLRLVVDNELAESA